MPLPVIADVYRCTFVFTSQMGQPSIVNVLHVRSTSGDVAAVAAAVDGGFSGLSDDPWDAMSEDYVLSHIDVLALDGTSATYIRVPSNISQGGQSGEKIMQASAVVSLHTAQRGSRGRGRIYIGPITEGVQNNGILNITSLNHVKNGWDTVFTNWEAGTPSLVPVIASYKHADAHDVTQLRVDRIIGTQRRRLDAIR